MAKPAASFDVESVRASWDDAAEVCAEGQASGRDHYRYEFFGPAQLALCGDVREMRVLDVGCGNGYFAREIAGRGARVTGIDISFRMRGAAGDAISRRKRFTRRWKIGSVGFWTPGFTFAPSKSRARRSMLFARGLIWRTWQGCRITCFST